MAFPRELRSRVAPQGIRLSVVLGILAAGAAGLSWPLLALALGLAAAANLAFFRNPHRLPPAGECLVVSPADGRVVEVSRLEAADEFVGRGWRIAIFLSIFNVHINRVPISGKVRGTSRAGQLFLAAFNPRASQLNVQLRLNIEAPTGARLGVAQVTGLIARRIVCYAREGDTVDRGDPYGLICYGSRVEVYLPEGSRILAKVGDRVRGAETVIAEVLR